MISSDWATEGGPSGSFTLRALFDADHDECILLTGLMTSVKGKEAAVMVSSQNLACYRLISLVAILVDSTHALWQVDQATRSRHAGVLAMPWHTLCTSGEAVRSGQDLLLII